MKLIKIVKYVLTIIIFSALQVTLCKNIAIAGIIPNIVMPLVISLAIFEGTITGAIVGLLLGLFADALSSGITVIHSLTYMYMAIISGNITNSYMRKNIGSALMFTFLGVVILEETIHFLHFAIWGVSDLFSAIINPILPTSIYSTILGLPIYFVTKKWHDRSNRRDYI